MVTSSALAVYFTELLKKLAKRLSKNPAFEFSPKAMAILLVLNNSLASLVLAGLGVEGYSFPTDWVAWSRVLVTAMIGALISSGLYSFGYLPFKFYTEYFYAELKAKSKAKKSK